MDINEKEKLHPVTGMQSKQSDLQKNEELEMQENRESEDEIPVDGDINTENATIATEDTAEVSAVDHVEIPKEESTIPEKSERIAPDPANEELRDIENPAKDPDQSEDDLKIEDSAKNDEAETKEDAEETHEELADQEEEHETEEHHLDYSNYTKKQMVQVLESYLNEDDFSQVGKILKEIKKPFDNLLSQEEQEAYQKYLSEGGEKDGFEYRGDELDQRFLTAYNKLRDRKNEFFNSLEIKKDQNLKTKLEILEKLRELVDSEETGASIKDLKVIQDHWKEVGPVPSSQLKSIWANYNALLDRFYDNRSIYFELKELDRKKNLDLKIELCTKAEQLAGQDDIREMIRQLNDLHEEFKHIGPVPKEDQEVVWERFKAASDDIYSKRKDFYEKLKQDLKINQLAKEALIEKVLPLAEFNSTKISEWNSKTKEIIAIQKEWETIGSLPKEKAKKINKQFWSAFKTFFSNKGLFFKSIEEERKENLKLKRQLVEKAEALKDSDDFQKTSEEFKKIQREWKEIGPVPERNRNEIFVQFKKACDHFFNRRRANSNVIEKEYEINLEAKKKICDELELMQKSGEIDLKRVRAIEAEWAEIGFVPRNSIKTIQRRYTKAIEELTEKMDVSDDEKHKLRFKAQFANMNFGPGSEKMIQKKEGALRRQITNLENEIGLWKNNIDFFTSSKNADKLRKEFEVKIEKASAQLQNLKEQLKIISNI